MRDVYFDPFGSYTQGYDKGTERQTQLEQSVRQSRDSDYNYNVLNPYKLNEIKRNDAFGEYAVPGTRKLFDNSVDASSNSLYDQNDAIARKYAMWSGDYSTVSDPALERFHRTLTQGPQVAQTGVTPYNVAGSPPQSVAYNPATDAAQQAVTAAAPAAGEGAPTPQQGASAQNAGQVFWDAWNNVKTKNPATMQVVADTLSKYYNIPPEQLHALALQNRPQQQDFSPENTGSILAGHGYTPQQLASMPPEEAQGLAQAIHRSQQTAHTSAMPPQGQHGVPYMDANYENRAPNAVAPTAPIAVAPTAPVQAPTAAYNIPPQQAPMQQAPSQASYILDANGNVRSTIPNIRDNVMGEVLYDRTQQQAKTQQDRMDNRYSQYIQGATLQKDYDYNDAIRLQARAKLHEAVTGAGFGYSENDTAP